MLGRLRKSTSTVVGECDCIFDIDMIFSKLEIKGGITKIKCNDKEKTKEKEVACKTFYNQITIHFEDNVNIKLFNNGKFHICGVKNDKITQKRLEYILDMIDPIRGEIYINPVFFKGVFVYKNRILKPHLDGFVCDNLIKNEKVLIDNGICEIFSLHDKKFLIQRTHENKQKKLYDCFGRYVGKVEYKMIRKSKNLCIKNALYVKKEEFLYDILKSEKYKNKIGELIVEIHKNYSDIDMKDMIKLYYSCCSKKPNIIKKNTINTNYNARMDIKANHYFDRDGLCKLLQTKGINFLYEPSKYPGVKFTILDTKITIFRTGSVLFSKKNEDTTTESIIKELQCLLKEEFIKERKEINNEKNDISIWDLI